MDLAVEQKKVGEIQGDMQTILETIEENDSLRDVLHSPLLTALDKKEALKAVFKKADPLTARFFDLLAHNKRVAILADICRQFTALYEQMQGQDIARVTTAVPINKSLEDKILKQLKAITGRDVVIENEIDPDLIGGFVLRLGDLEYNASIHNQLDSLKREFLKN
jgi:F-type H+-transporting ATPase subunit delta